MHTVVCNDCDTVCSVAAQDDSIPEYCPICGSDDVVVSLMME